MLNIVSHQIITKVKQFYEDIRMNKIKTNDHTKCWWESQANRNVVQFLRKCKMAITTSKNSLAVS